MKFKSFSNVALFLLAGLALGCTNDTFKVGAILPLTGDAKTFGAALEKGIKLAQEELEADPAVGHRIELPIVDSESNPEKAKEQLEKLYKDGALVAIGGVTSDEALAMISVIDRFDRVLLSPSASSPQLSGASRNFYRIFPSDTLAGIKMATFITLDIKVSKVIILAETNAFAKGIEEVFKHEYESRGGTVVEVIEYPPNTTDFSGLVERVMTLESDAVYLAAYDESTAALIRELHRLKYPGRILTTSAFATPAAIARVGQDAAGVVLTQTVFEVDSDHAVVKSFVEAFRAKYGEDPDIYAAHGYDAMKLLGHAIQGRTLLASEVAKGLRHDVYGGVTGEIRFDDKGDVQKYPGIYVIGEDLALYNYGERIEQEKRRIEEERRKLRERVEELRREAQQIGTEG